MAICACARWVVWKGCPRISPEPLVLDWSVAVLCYSVRPGTRRHPEMALVQGNHEIQAVGRHNLRKDSASTSDQGYDLTADPQMWYRSF